MRCPFLEGIQVGMGPAGELRYPSRPSEKLSWARRHLRQAGEFQCYDKYMIASLNAHVQNVGKPEKGNVDPLGADCRTHDPGFFRSDDGTWNTPYGQFFIKWYSGMLLQHGERLSMAAATIFLGTGVKISVKVAAIHWHYTTRSHLFKLTAGCNNTLINHGYLLIACMLGMYNMMLCCKCFDL
ncbi:beta-amylase 2, chloroplastic-like isoform X2 [Magnolia sinica]|uniref:beta-amylase 2, chloroplastic-like isoform X2 n=1 Tax=Magnolia sinica TaxID=86752 RepID=UPI00265AAFD2|nr:beta-amylase 2, chloroplastic-like isoform X2 [Magnolia sinica]